MRFMEFWFNIFCQSDFSKPECTIKIPGINGNRNVEFTISFKYSYPHPKISNSHANDHVAIYPLTSIVHQYFQHGNLNEKRSEQDNFDMILNIIRVKEF